MSAHVRDHPFDSGRPLTDRDVDADHVVGLLIGHDVERERSFAGRALTDDQLALPASDRKQRVEHQLAGLDRLVHQVAVDDPRRAAFDRVARVGADLGAFVERPP